MKFAPRRKPKATIPIAAMADIAMLLVIFFLVTSRLMNEAGIKVKPPGAAHASAYKAEEKSIIIDENGETHFNGVPTPPDEIRRALSEVIPTDENVPVRDRLVTVKCDAKRPYDELVTVIAAVSDAGGEVVITTDYKETKKN
jgi:biopolymer transport protein ExbD